MLTSAYVHSSGSFLVTPFFLTQTAATVDTVVPFVHAFTDVHIAYSPPFSFEKAAIYACS